MARSAAMIPLLAAAALTGCGAQSALLGTEKTYLFGAYDVLCTPGQTVALRARLQAGDFLRGRAGHVVRFRREAALYAAALTDGDGVAAVSFTPRQSGDIVFTADVAPSGLPDAPPQPARLVVACRPADAPLVVVDLDKTLVASGFQEVLLGSPAPMPDSPRVMRRIAEKHGVVYLTHRPDLFGPKSKAYLRRHGYPEGPLLLSDIRGFLQGSEAFKSGMLAELRRQFCNLQVGIGDKISDAAAYHANGIRALLIVQPDDIATAEGLAELAGQIERGLPPEVQVVTNWRQIEQAIFEGRSFSRDEMVRHLRSLAGGRAPATAPAAAGGASGGGAR